MLTDLISKISVRLLSYVAVAVAAVSFVGYVHHLGYVAGSAEVPALRASVTAQQHRADAAELNSKNLLEAFDKFKADTAASGQEHLQVDCAIVEAPDTEHVAPSTAARLRSLRRH